MLGEIIAEFFRELVSGLIGSGIRRLGAWVRWVFKGKKKTFEEVLEEDWNRRVGWSIVVILCLLAYFLISKVFFPDYEILKVVEENQH